jgi:hypothetical protein
MNRKFTLSKFDMIFKFAKFSWVDLIFMGRDNKLLPKKKKRRLKSIYGGFLKTNKLEKRVLK